MEYLNKLDDMKNSSHDISDIIDKLQKKIQSLSNENRLLKERLDENGISYDDIVSNCDIDAKEQYDPNQGARIKKFEITDKIASDFFMLFCHGRKDV